jgi:MoaA/NifB/PqqE/SkfB family radical SAM enzyme
LHTYQILQAWGKILKGEPPSLSIEITRECPLKCPGCYAYDDAHLGGGQTLRDLNDRRGQALVDGVLEVVDRLKPLHLSIVGGDPLVRFRELELLLPLLLARGIHVQIVTSAFRTMGPTWANLERLNVVVSIDGLQPEHDLRRAPATYDRILKNIVGQRVTVHCTITAQMMKRTGYLAEFLEFWTPRPEIKRVWFSMFTPQVGDQMPEILSPEERGRAIAEIGYAGGSDSAVCLAAAKSTGLCFRAHHSDPVGGSGNPYHSLPVRGKSRLRLLRLPCLHGLGLHR